MAVALANSKAVIEAAIRMTLTGAWQADLRVDHPDELTDPITISIGDGRLVLIGAVDRGGSFQETASLRVVAGAANLQAPARARHYNSTSVRVVLQDLLRDAGEKLSSTADAALLAKPLLHWTTLGKPTGRIIAALVKSASGAASWRMLADGSLWAGTETWPESGITAADVDVLNETPEMGTMLLGVESPTLLPGVTLFGRHVASVEHLISDERGIRTQVWFEDG